MKTRNRDLSFVLRTKTSSVRFTRSNIGLPNLGDTDKFLAEEYEQSFIGLVRWFIHMPVYRYDLSAWFSLYWHTVMQALHLAVPERICDICLGL